MKQRKLVAVALLGAVWTTAIPGALAGQLGWKDLGPVAYSDAQFQRDVKRTDGYANYGAAAGKDARGAAGRVGEIRYPIQPETKAFFELLSVTDGNPDGRL